MPAYAPGGNSLKIQAALDAAVAEVMATARTAVKGYATVAAMTAALASIADDEIVSVDSDPTPANNQNYRKTGGVMVAVGATRMTLLEGLTNPWAWHSGGLPIVYDFGGHSGEPVRSFLVPSTIFYSRKGNTTAYSSVVSGTASTKLAGYNVLPALSSSVVPFMLWYDTATNAYGTTNWVTGAFAAWGTKIPICVVYGNSVLAANFPVEVLGDHPTIHFMGPFVVRLDAAGNGTTIQLPNLRVNNGAKTTTTAPTDYTVGGVATAPRYRAKIIDFGNVDSVEILYVDLWAHARGENPYIVKAIGSSTNNLPRNKNLIPVLFGLNGRYYSPLGVRVLGSAPGGVVANQSRLGRNNLEYAAFVVPSETLGLTSIVAPNADAIALGFTDAYTSSTGQIYYGSRISEDGVQEAYAAVSIIVESNTDNTWPAMVGYFECASSTLGIGVTLEEVLTPRLAIFSGEKKFVNTVGENNRVIGISVGCEANALAPKLMGLQVAYGHQHIDAVFARWDYPEPFLESFVGVPDVLYNVNEWPMRLYPNNTRRTGEQKLDVASELSYQYADKSWGDVIAVPDGTVLNTTGWNNAAARLMSTSRFGKVGLRQWSNLTFKSKPWNAVNGLTLRGHVWGDSLAEATGLPWMIRDYLERGGATVHLVASRQTQDYDNGRSAPSEGRTGKQAQSFIGKKMPPETIGVLKPIADWPAYLTHVDGDLYRFDFSPYLFEVAPATPDAYQYTGPTDGPLISGSWWKVDIDQYLTAISDTGDLDFIVSQILTNDAGSGGPTGPADGRDAYDIMYRDQRAAFPDTHIILPFNPIPIADVGGLTNRHKWDTEIVPLFDTMLEWYFDQSDPKLHIVPCHLYAGKIAGYDYEMISGLEDMGGFNNGRVSASGFIHYRDPVTHIVARSIAAVIINELGV